MTLITDYQTPIGPKSERWLAAVDATDPAKVALALEKAVKNEPNVRRREIAGFYRMGSHRAAAVGDTEELVIEVPGGKVRHADVEVEEYEPVAFQPGKSRTKAKSKARRPQKQQQRTIQNVSLTVAHDHLFVASHLDLLERVLKHAGAQQNDSRQGAVTETACLGGRLSVRCGRGDQNRRSCSHPPPERPSRKAGRA